MGTAFRLRRRAGRTRPDWVGDDDEQDAEAQRCVSGPPALIGKDCLPHAWIFGLLMITELLALSIQGWP